MFFALLSTISTVILAVPVDTTGVSAAFTRLAQMGVGMIGGVTAFFVVVNGYQYLTANDDIQKSSHAKRAMGGVIFGALIVILGTTIAPSLINTIVGP